MEADPHTLHHPHARNQAIDGLRGYSVAAVIGVHLLQRFFPGGGLGVDIFFVISGYVITIGLKREFEQNGNISLRRFYVRRVRRLWPALWLMIGFCVLVGPLVGQPSLREAVLAIASVMNWARAMGLVEPSHALGHSWSLAVEEQFYLLWPPALLFFLARPKLAVPILSGIILAAFAWRFWLLSSGSEAASVYTYNALECRMVGLLLGCLLALRVATVPPLLRKLWFVPATILAALVLLRDPGLPLFLRYDVIALLSAWLVAAAINAPPAMALLTNNAAAQWAGSRSYSLYLWHAPLSYYLLPADIAFPAKFALVLIATAIASELSFRLVEQRFYAPTRVPLSGFASAVRT